MSNKEIFHFTGQSNVGERPFAILCGSACVRAFWAAFAKESVDLRTFQLSIIRMFYSLASRGEPAKMLEEQGDDFLLTEYSIRRWLLYWKGLDIQGAGYLRRHMVYLAVYAVRYCLSRHGEQSPLSQKLKEYIGSKEFATFVLDGWTGDGIVGFMTTSDGDRTVMKEFRFANTALARIYCDYFESGVATIRASEFNTFADTFEESLGEFAPDIRAYGDFSEGSLLHQAKYYRENFIGNPSMARKALRHVVGFYRFIVNTEAGCRIFDGGNFSPRLLRSMTVLRYLSEGWEVAHYKTIDSLEGRRRLVVVLKDMTHLGTRFVNGDAIAIDMSMVETDYYRNVLWRYIRSSRSVLFSGSNIGYIGIALHVLEESKRLSHKNLTTLNSTETLQIKNTFTSSNRSDQTIKGLIITIRSFFAWTTEQRLLVAESPIVLSCLVFRSERTSASVKAQAIPRQDLDRIRGRLAMEAERSYRSRLIFVIVDILSVTGFRPSQVCKMEVSGISFVKKKGYYILNCVSKTSRGQRKKFPLTSEVYEELAALINDSAALRERCYDPDIKDMVFLYEGVNGFDRIVESDVKLAMELTCDVLELPRWTPYNLRKMYATVWDEFDRRKGFHGELAAQALGHKSYNVTRRHYIDRTFEEFRRVADADRISTDEMMQDEYNRLMNGEKL